LEWNWAKAKNNYLISIELNPKYAQAHAYYGLSCLNTIEGKFSEGEKYGRQAIILDPLSAIYHADLAWTIYNARRFEEAIQMANTGIELDNNSFLSHKIAGLCYLALHKHDEAIEIFNNLIRISNRHQYALHYLIWAYCNAGQFEKAEKLMEELKKRSESEFIARTYMGLSAAWLNDIENALIYLEQGRLDRDSIIITINQAPHVPDKLRKDPRFQDLLGRVGFPLN
jgi:pentatricopeptide repeat protein